MISKFRFTEIALIPASVKSLIRCAALIAVLTSTAAAAADGGDPKKVVMDAAKKLGEQANYSWRSTVVVPESSPFKPGPVEGRTEKDGFTHVTSRFGENLNQTIRKGDKTALTDMEGNWKLISEMENEEGPGRFLGSMAKALKTPAVQAADLVASVKELKLDGEAYSGEMSDQGVKKQFMFGEPRNAKGQVKFWVKGGVLTRFESKVEAKMEFNGNEFDASRTTTVEIKEVGSTKLEVPEAAKKKF